MNNGLNSRGCKKKYTVLTDRQLGRTTRKDRLCAICGDRYSRHAFNDNGEGFCVEAKFQNAKFKAKDPKYRRTG